MPGHAAHYRGDYQRRARRVRDLAYADPSTRCWRCGRTLVEHPAGDRWQAGHVRDGDRSSPLLAEARSCNASAGQALTLGRQVRAAWGPAARWR